MARIRSVHPGLYTDEGFISLSIAARLFYIGIWSEADDHGAFAWKPFTLKARILPADNVDAKALLQEMVDLGMIKEALDGEKPIGLIKNFCKWQRPKKPSLFFEIPDHLREFVGLDDEEEDNRSKRKAIWARFNGRCFYCGSEVSYYSKRHDSLEIDHVTPVSKGGSDGASNLVCACRGCNRSKKDMSASEFFAFRKLKKLPVSEGFANSFGEVSHSESNFSHSENGFRVAEGRKVGREEGRKVIPSLRSGPPEPVAEPDQPVDARTMLFREGKTLLHHMTGKPEAQCGNLIGRWLKTCRDRCDLLLSIIREAAEHRPADVVSWIEGAVKHRTSSGLASRHERVAEAWAGVPDIEGV